MKKRKDGLYAAQIYLGTEPVLNANGSPVLDEKGNPKLKRKYKTLYHQKQSELKKMVAQIKAKMGKGMELVDSKDTFEVWADIVISDKKAAKVSHKQVQNLEAYKEKFKSIYKTQLDKITLADIQQIINRLAVYHDGERPLSKETLRKTNRFARQVFDKAIAARLIDYNPARYTVVAEGASSKHRTAISDQQRQWIEDTPNRAQTAAMIMLYAGLRRGEVLALTWADVDLSAGTIRVNKAVEFVDNEPLVKAPKTEAGNRVVPMPKRLIEFLKSQKSDYLYVVHDDGKQYTSSKWHWMWRSYMIDLDIKYGYNNSIHRNDPKKKGFRISTFTPHQLRHTYATMLYKSGIDVMRAKYLLGHTDIKVTLGIYTHLENEGRLTGASELDAFLGDGASSMQVEEN